MKQTRHEKYLIDHKQKPRKDAPPGPDGRDGAAGCRRVRYRLAA
jgi:hypothetical protein